MQLSFIHISVITSYRFFSILGNLGIDHNNVPKWLYYRLHYFIFPYNHEVACYQRNSIFRKALKNTYFLFSKTPKKCPILSMFCSTWKIILSAHPTSSVWLFHFLVWIFMLTVFFENLPPFQIFVELELKLVPAFSFRSCPAFSTQESRNFQIWFFQVAFLSFFGNCFSPSGET